MLSARIFASAYSVARAYLARTIGALQHVSVWSSLILSAALTAQLVLASEPEVVRVDPGVLSNVSAEKVTDAPPVLTVVSKNDATHKGAIAFSGADNGIIVGVAAYDTVSLELKDWPFDEVMIFLEGKLQFTSQSGVVEEVSAGDIIVVPKGYSGTWVQLEPIRKVSIIHDADGYYDGLKGQ